MASITVATTTIPGWQGNSSGVQLRVFNNDTFAAASGTIYPQSELANGANIGTFFRIFACTDGSGSLTIPAITLDSTTDSPDNPNATYTAVLWDTTQARMVQVLGTFPLPATPTSTTWAALLS